jgi:hypothetical protein
MATNFNHFTQASSGAPAIEGVAGALITWLDWILDVSNTNTRKVADKVYSGSNKAVYRFTTGNRGYFRVDDSAAQEAQVRQYESMSDVDTGVDPSPLLTTYAAGSFVIRKSFEANGNDRDWKADVWSRGLLFYVKGALSASTTHEVYFLGDLVREDGISDSWNSCIVARNATGSSASNGYLGGGSSVGFALPMPANSVGAFNIGIMRNKAGTIKAPACCAAYNPQGVGRHYPDTDFLYLARVSVGSGQVATAVATELDYRGYIPYLWRCMSNTSDAALAIDTTHSDASTGASFVMLKSTNTTTAGPLCLLMETTDTDPLVP